jgi:predicted nucleic acid-binding protein
MHREAQLAVVDATPIIALALIGRMDLLQRLYSQVVMPLAVQAEVFAGGPVAVGSAELRQATWLRVISLQDTRRAELLSDLDRGEAEVIALAQELDADLVIIDERMARRHARRLGLRLTGTLGVLLRAKSLGLVPSIEPLIKQLLRGGIRLSDAVVIEALRLAGEVPASPTR